MDPFYGLVKTLVFTFQHYKLHDVTNPANTTRNESQLFSSKCILLIKSKNLQITSLEKKEMFKSQIIKSVVKNNVKDDGNFTNVDDREIDFDISPSVVRVHFTADGNLLKIGFVHLR